MHLLLLLYCLGVHANADKSIDSYHRYNLSMKYWLKLYLSADQTHYLSHYFSSLKYLPLSSDWIRFCPPLQQ